MSQSRGRVLWNCWYSKIGTFSQHIFNQKNDLYIFKSLQDRRFQNKLMHQTVCGEEPSAMSNTRGDPQAVISGVREPGCYKPANMLFLFSSVKCWRALCIHTQQYQYANPSSYNQGVDTTSIQLMLAYPHGVIFNKNVYFFPLNTSVTDNEREIVLKTKKQQRPSQINQQCFSY